MVVGLLGNKSLDSNRLTLVTPKSENDVRLQATLGNQNPTGKPVGAVSQSKPDWLEKVSREEYWKLYADIEQNAMDEWYRLEDEKSQLT